MLVKQQFVFYYGFKILFYRFSSKANITVNLDLTCKYNHKSDFKPVVKIVFYKKGLFNCYFKIIVTGSNCYRNITVIFIIYP